MSDQIVAIIPGDSLQADDHDEIPDCLPDPLLGGPAIDVLQDLLVEHLQGDRTVGGDEAQHLKYRQRSLAALGAVGKKVTR